MFDKLCQAVGRFFLLAVTMTVFAASAQTSPNVEAAIKALDRALDHREDIIGLRQFAIDSLKELCVEKITYDLLLSIGDSYCSFSNDSAIAYYRRASGAAENRQKQLVADLKRLSLMPLSGIFEGAADEYESIDTCGLTHDIMLLYHESGRKLNSYIASAYSDHPAYHSHYIDKALKCQEKLIRLLPKDSNDYIFNLGEYFFLTGNNDRAKELLTHLLTQTDDRGLKARAHHHLAELAAREESLEAYRFHLASSAIADVESATLEVISLQQLGNSINTDGEIDRAYRYMSVALDNAVRCGASLRMIESSRALPLIASAYNRQISNWRTMIYVIMGIMLLLLVVLAITLFVLYRKMKHLNRLRERLGAANDSKILYINQFLKLCSVYMDKLNQLCHIVERKLSAGKADELLRLTKSGRFIEDHSSDFYVIIDNVFLHIYPDFVARVNELLRPECQIVLMPGEVLNTDLRILAIRRMGIDDAASAAKLLNYSLNTIYAYRNRLKARAINRDTFEDDIMKIKATN